MGVISEADEFALDLLPSVETFVKQLLAAGPCNTAMDFAKNLLHLKVFETIDNALVLGYLLEYLLEGHKATSDNLSFSLATVLAHTSLEQNSSVDFAFVLMGKTDKMNLTLSNFNDFLELHTKLFREAGACEQKEPQLISFVFRKGKHQQRVETVYNKLVAAKSKLSEKITLKTEEFKDQISNLFDSDDVFRAQLTCLYKPFRMLCIHIVSKVSPEPVQKKSEMFLENFQSPSATKLLAFESGTSLHM